MLCSLTSDTRFSKEGERINGTQTHTHSPHDRKDTHMHIKLIRVMDGLVFPGLSLSVAETGFPLISQPVTRLADQAERSEAWKSKRKKRETDNFLCIRRRNRSAHTITGRWESKISIRFAGRSVRRSNSRRRHHHRRAKGMF